MNNHDVTVYVSDNNVYCTKVVDLIKEYNVSYRVKNVTQNKEYMKDLQSHGIYGTPALFVKGERKPILGYQKKKILSALAYAENN